MHARLLPVCCALPRRQRNGRYDVPVDAGTRPLILHFTNRLVREIWQIGRDLGHRTHLWSGILNND